MKKKVSIALAILFSIAANNPSFCAEAKDGKALVKDKGCLHCHFIEGDGGFLGPPLDGIGKYRKKKEIVDILSHPAPIKLTHEGPVPAEELMKHVVLNRADAGKIADYLITLPDAEFKLSHEGLEVENLLPKGFKFNPNKPTRDSRKGFKLFQKSGCLACHQVRGKGGKLAPELDGVGISRSRSYIENRIKNGAIVIYDSKRYKPSKYSMPPSKLSKRQIEQITDFLLTLPEPE